MNNRKCSIFTAFLSVLVCLASAGPVSAQVDYGNNIQAGKQLAMKDGTSIYYEVYGTGRPVVLLHGGLFGDISEYAQLIPKLAARFQVIAVGTRGHARSAIGHTPYTYSLLAEDASTVARHVSSDSAILIGFSDGAVVAMSMTIAHPELVRKLVFLAGNPIPSTFEPGVWEEAKATTGQSMEQKFSGFVKQRKAAMQEPQRWNEFVAYLTHAWSEPVYIDTSGLAQIKCPVLVIGGDRDPSTSVATFGQLCRSIPHAQLAILPGSDHLILWSRPDLIEALILPFL